MAPTTKKTSPNGVSRQRESGLMSMETTKRSRYLRHCRSIYRVDAEREPEPATLQRKPTTRIPRKLTDRRKDMIREFMTDFLAKPHKYGNFATHSWAEALIQHMREKPHYGLAAEDVRFWMEKEDFFESELVNLLPRRLKSENPFPRGPAPMTYFLHSDAPCPATPPPCPCSISPDVLPNDQIASENTPIQVDRSLETKPGEERKEAGNFFVPPMPLSRRREYVSRHFSRGPAPMTFLHSHAPRPASGGIISPDVLPNDHIASEDTQIKVEGPLEPKPGEEHKEAGNVFVPPMPLSRRREYVSQVLLVRKIRGPLDKMTEIIDGMKRSNQTDINIEELSRNFDMIKRILNVSTNKVCNASPLPY